MKYIVERNGIKFIETTSGFEPADSIVEYTGQVPEEDIPFCIITDGVDEFGKAIKIITVDSDLKVADFLAKNAAKEAEDDEKLAKDLKKAELKVLKANDLTTIDELSAAVIKILEVLNIK